MEKRELIQQLKNLKSIKPDENWKNSNREILLSQISNFAPSNIINEAGKTYDGWQKKISIFLHQPALAVAIVCLLIVGGSAFSLQAAGSKPGSSLYVAKVISEQARLAITFDTEKKAKLDFKFTSEHVKDIASVLADPKINDRSQEKSDKLTENFKKEITAAKSKLFAIPSIASNSSQNSGKQEAEDIKVFSANLEKEDTGLQVAVPEMNNKDEKPAETTPVESSETATSTESPENGIGVGKAAVGGIEEAHKILNEAEELFNEKNYSGTLDKIEEAEAIVNGATEEKSGQVKGETEATSTVLGN